MQPNAHSAVNMRGRLKPLGTLSAPRTWRGYVDPETRMQSTMVIGDQTTEKSLGPQLILPNIVASIPAEEPLEITS